MVDAALGNDDELSDSSKHRTALQLGKRQLATILEECEGQSEKMKKMGEVIKNMRSSLKMMQQQEHQQQQQQQELARGDTSSASPSSGGGTMSEELQSMIIRVIRERNEARDEAERLKKELLRGKVSE